jgi:hypothetical protein
MKTWPKVIGLALIAASAYWWSEHRDRGEVDELRGSVQALRRAVDATDRDVALTAARTARAPRPAAEAPASPPPSTEEPATAATSGPPARPPTIDAPTLRAHLDTRFERQFADAGWSATARVQLEQRLASLMPPQSTLKSVECKETMCRIEMVYGDLAQYQAFMRQLTPDALPWNGTLFSSRVGDASERPATIVAFLSREGQELAVD